MTKLDKLIADLLLPKFEYWKQYLTQNERRAFELFYIKKYTVIQISQEMNYSDRQVNRLLKSARVKVEKHIS